MKAAVKLSVENETLFRLKIHMVLCVTGRLEDSKEFHREAKIIPFFYYKF